MRLKFLIGLSLGAFLQPPQAVQAMPLPTRTIALTGTAPIGAPAGAVYDEFFSPQIDEQGRIAFSGGFNGFTGATNQNRFGLWLNDGASTSLVARQTMQAPGFDPGMQLFISSPILSNGRIAFVGSASPDGQTSFMPGAWIADASGLRLFARGDQPLPGAPVGATTTEFSILMPNASGDVAMRVGFSTRGPDNQSHTGIYRASMTNPASLTPVAISGTPIPQGTSSQTFATVWYPRITSSGRGSFMGGTYEGTTVSTDDSIWTFDVTSNTPTRAAHIGAPVPGAPTGTTFTRFGGILSDPSINSAGDLLFPAQFAGPGTSSQNDKAMFIRDASGLRMLARLRDPAPGTPSSIFHKFESGGIGNDGVALITASTGITGPTYGIWKGTSAEDLEAVAYSGGVAPGLPAGVTFRYALSRTRNNVGDFVFETQLRGPGITTANDIAIWMSRTSGADDDVLMLLREGDAFTVGPGDVRTIASLQVGDEIASLGGDDGWPHVLNDRRELTFVATFTDGSSGVFVTTIPEPSSALLIPFAASSVLFIRRRTDRAPRTRRYGS